VSCSSNGSKGRGAARTPFSRLCGMATPDEPLGLAFFEAERYLVQDVTGAIAVPGLNDYVVQSPGWHYVSRDELFERWPNRREQYERLRTSLR